MKTYELTYIISSEITSEEAGITAKKINSFIESKEGVILKSDNPVAKTLSYPIKKLGSGYFVVLEFQIEPEKLNELKEYMQNPPAGGGKILRHMITIKKPVKARKERRGARKPLFSAETEPAEQKSMATEETKEKPNKKIELEDIEKKLEEILGE